MQTTQEMGGTVAAEGIATTIVRDQMAFEGLATEWNELYDSSRSGTSFQSHAWLTAWARAYCPPGKLRVFLVRSSGRLVAAAPLHLTRQGPWRVLAPLGGELADFGDLLVPADEPRVAAALADALGAEPGWSVLDLPHVRPDASVRMWIPHWPGQVTSLVGSSSLELPGRPIEEILGRLPGRSAKVIRRKLRNADELGIDVSDVPPEAVPGAVAAMLRLHEEQWRGRGMTPEHGTARFAAHLTEAMQGMVTGGQARIAEYRVDGAHLASQLYLIGHGLVGAYLAGISPRFRELADVSAVMVREDLRFATELGIARYSMMRGVEEYKLRWRPDPVVNNRLLLGRHRSLPRFAYVRLAVARNSAVRLVKQWAPWVKELLSRLGNRTS